MIEKRSHRHLKCQSNQSRPMISKYATKETFERNNAVWFPDILRYEKPSKKINRNICRLTGKNINKISLVTQCFKKKTWGRPTRFFLRCNTVQER